MAQYQQNDLGQFRSIQKVRELRDALLRVLVGGKVCTDISEPEFRVAFAEDITLLDSYGYNKLDTGEVRQLIDKLTEEIQVWNRNSDWPV